MMQANSLVVPPLRLSAGNHGYRVLPPPPPPEFGTPTPMLSQTPGIYQQIYPPRAEHPQKFGFEASPSFGPSER
eukprot:12297594-Prorocentrum_lima.AAC.1